MCQLTTWILWGLIAFVFTIPSLHGVDRRLSTRSFNDPGRDI